MEMTNDHTTYIPPFEQLVTFSPNSNNKQQLQLNVQWRGKVVLRPPSKSDDDNNDDDNDNDDEDS